MTEKPRKVKINRISHKSVFAIVEDMYPVWIQGIGSDHLRYSCSCKDWAQNMETGCKSLCSHYYAVVAKLIIEGKLSKEHITSIEEKQLIESYIKRISEFEKSNQMVNLRHLKAGKIVLCDYCKHIPIKNIVAGIELSNPYHISEVKESSKGFIVTGTARCVKCGKLEKVVNKISIELAYLKCPVCGKDNLKASLMKANNLSDGYKFSIVLSCKDRSCVWKKALVSKGHSAYSLLRRLKVLNITKDGVEVELNPEKL